MEEQFTEEELSYINANVYDSTQNVYIEKPSKLFISNYNIRCRNLAKGKYSLDTTIGLPMHEQAGMICGDLRGKLADESISLGFFTFNILDNCTFSLRTQYPCRKSTIQDVVRSLRMQSITNAKNTIKQESLIVKDIKSRSTDLGEDYNRESFYSTIYDCLANNETLEVDKTKPVNNYDTKNLRLLKIMQEKSRLQHQIDDLNKQEQDLLNL